MGCKICRICFSTDIMPLGSRRQRLDFHHYVGNEGLPSAGIGSNPSKYDSGIHIKLASCSHSSVMSGEILSSHCNCCFHSLCMIVLYWIVMGDNHPSGSKTLEIVCLESNVLLVKVPSKDKGVNWKYTHVHKLRIIQNHTEIEL
ncbi:hypothetical protein TNCV_1754701 [Trichonephila clavipes]|nr:hypothetical protein TNCV_1754701 [Trichonephila clavipes]